MSTSSTTPTTPMTSMTLREVLSLFLVCFEVGIASRPLSPLACARRRDDLLPGVTVWQLWTDKDMDNPPEDLSSLPPPPDFLYKAYVKWNCCDYFCVFLETEVNRKLKGKRLGTNIHIRHSPYLQAIVLLAAKII